MRVLAVGVATLDIVNQVAAYPAEDAEVRATDQRISRGGNATNTLVVLSQLGHACEWAGVTADEPGAALVLEDLAHYGVGTRHIIQHRHGKLPTSYITLSAATGSRTIVHFRDLPEYPVDAFRMIGLRDYDWIHFEGRDVPALTTMLEDVRRSGGPPCSLEVEKPRRGIEQLFGMVDMLLFSRHYAHARGHARAEALLHTVAALEIPAVCAWGKLGAWGCDEDGRIYCSPVASPARVVDTLGAGDVFNAAMINAWAAGKNMQQCLSAATLLAGRKCAQRGFDGLRLT